MRGVVAAALVLLIVGCAAKAPSQADSIAGCESGDVASCRRLVMLDYEGVDADRLLEYARRSMQRLPDDDDGFDFFRFLYGILLTQAGDAETGAREIRTAAASGPGFTEQALKWGCLYWVGIEEVIRPNPQRAASIFMAVRLLEDVQSELYFFATAFLATLRLNIEEFESARVLAHEAAELQPRNAGIQMLAAQIALGMDDYVAAIDHYLKVVNLGACLRGMYKELSELYELEDDETAAQHYRTLYKSTHAEDKSCNVVYVDFDGWNAVEESERFRELLE